MRECPQCSICYDDSVTQCPVDGRSTFHSLPGDVALEGKYVLERRLGEGGMGIVYKAHHRFLKTTRAIKIIKPELVGNDPSFAKRFHQEAMAAAAIGHPNIISVPDFGFLEEKVPFIVMEYVEGISLQDLMSNEGRFTPEKALEYIRVIASAVGAAHANGIVHRDLKPLNIMIQKTGSVREQIRILDFGLAKIKSADLLGSFVGAKTTGIIGSPYYMAPEQWSDEETDKKCDIYSLGIILYQMLTGDVPFKGSSIPAIMKKHLMTAPPPLAISGTGISPQLERVVYHALEKDPKNRTASADDLVAELEQAVADSALTKKTRGRPRTKAKTAAAPGPKQNEAALNQPHSLDSNVVEDRPRQVSSPDLNTIVKPSTHAQLDPVSSQPSIQEAEAKLSSSEADLLRKATEEARRKAEARALREVEESGDLSIVTGVSPRTSLPPQSGPGRVLVGQHSVTGSIFRKPFVVPISVAALVIAVIGLFIFIYVRPESTVEPSKPETPLVKPVNARGMVLIDGGVFTMGSNSAGEEQKGEHLVTVKPFYIDKYEVTNAEYAEFIKATGRQAPAVDEKDPVAKGTNWWKPWNGNTPPAGREKWPVCNVTPKDAEEFAAWLSVRDGVKYRLPSEEEWEFAARNGSKGSLFPWGDSWIDGRANLNQKASPTDVGSFPDGATQHGVLDMVGNVWEWTSSRAKNYNGSPVTADPNGRVRRGGSFAEKIKEHFGNTTDRSWFKDDNYKFPTIGFRLARDKE